MTQEELVKLLRAVHQLDIKEEQERLVTENATCIDPTRIRIGLLRGDWTSEEEKHFYTCSRCRGFRQKIQREIWHPTIRQLWSIAAQGYPEVRFAEATNLVEKHLENDRCGRCIFVRDIFDKVLRRTKPGTIGLEDPGFDHFLGDSARAVVDLRSLTQSRVSDEELFGMSLMRSLPSKKLKAWLSVTAATFADDSDQQTLHQDSNAIKIQFVKETIGWVIRIRSEESVQVPSLVRLTLLDRRGSEDWRGYVFLTPGSNQSFAAAIHVSRPDIVSGSHLVSLILPGAVVAETDVEHFQDSLRACEAVDPHAHSAWQEGIEFLKQTVSKPILRSLNTMTLGKSEPKFQISDVVQRVNQPEVIGVVLESRRDTQTNTWKYLVQFGADHRVVPEEGLRRLVVTRTPWDALRANSFSGRDHFVFTLTLHRLRYPPARIANSFATTRTQFFPHQFKPLLKFLENPGKRLLVADDVGLGKTIEAGYILRELDARQGRLDRVLALVPAKLTRKWKQEMLNRFGEHFEVVKGTQILQQTERVRQGRDLESFRWILSYEGARAQEVERAISETQIPIDLLIADEAHRMRHSETLQHRVGRSLCSCADAVVFLTATPVQTSLENLWTLFRLLSPNEFPRTEIFETQMNANRCLLRAQQALARPRPDLQEARKFVSDFLKLMTLQGVEPGAFAKSVLDRLQGNGLERRQVVELQCDLGLLSPIGHILSRTRKAEALANRPVRDAGWVSVQLTGPERAIYDSVEDACRQAWRGGADWGFHMSLLTAYRMTASCIPAAIEYFKEKLAAQIPTPSILEADEIEEDDRDFNQTAWNTLNSRRGFQSAVDLYMQASVPDRKLEKLIDVITSTWEADRQQNRKQRKIVVFSFFRRTLRYLEIALTQAGVENRMIRGGMPLDDREVAIDAFLQRDDINVLLTSEVGGEGIDLQKACVVINYDLPWNPMVVEQRIGRIDRIGQESPVIYILNFVVEDSVEERILARLLRRIDVFRESIGELDEIIGDQIEDLTVKVFSGEIGEDEVETVLEQQGQAVERRIQEARQMLSKVDGLLAADQALIDEVNAVIGERQLPNENELLLFLNHCFAKRYPGIQLPNAVTRGVAEVDLRGNLATDLERASVELGDDALLLGRRIATGTIPITLSRDAAFRHHRSELIHLQHPLTRFAVTMLRQNGQQPTSFALRLPSSRILMPGRYAFLLTLLHFNTFQRTTKLVALFHNWLADTVWADPEQTTPVLIEMLEAAQDDTPSELSDNEFDPIRTRLLAAIENLQHEWEARERRSEEARAEQRHASRAASFEFRVRAAQERHTNLRNAGAPEFPVRMAQAQLDKAIRERDAFLAQPAKIQWAGVEYEEITVGILTVGN